MRKLNKELMVKEPVKDSDKDVVNYSNMNEKLDTIISLMSNMNEKLDTISSLMSNMNEKLDTIISLMSNMLSELKKLNTYNDDKIKSVSLFNPFG